MMLKLKRAIRRVGTTTPMTYNAADELTRAGSTSYSHDANGNMTSGTAGLEFT